MRTTTINKPSKTVCQKVLAAIIAQNKGYIAAGGEPPTLVMDFDWTGSGPHPAVVWEGGPYEWTYLFPHGGIEEEFGTRVSDVSARIPAGWHTEPITSWAIGIYRAF